MAVKALLNFFRRPPPDQPMARLLALEAALPLQDAARTVRPPLLGAIPCSRPCCRLCPALRPT